MEPWKEFILDKTFPINAASLSLTVKRIMPLMLAGGQIDLTGFDPEQVNGMHLSVALRLTLSRKATTPGWDEAFEVAVMALRRDGLDPFDALSGMIHALKVS